MGVVVMIMVLLVGSIRTRRSGRFGRRFSIPPAASTTHRARTKHRLPSSRCNSTRSTRPGSSPVPGGSASPTCRRARPSSTSTTARVSGGRGVEGLGEQLHRAGGPTMGILHAGTALGADRPSWMLSVRSMIAATSGRGSPPPRWCRGPPWPRGGLHHPGHVGTVELAGRWKGRGLAWHRPRQVDHCQEHPGRRRRRRGGPPGSSAVRGCPRGEPALVCSAALSRGRGMPVSDRASRRRRARAGLGRPAHDADRAEA